MRALRRDLLIRVLVLVGLCLAAALGVGTFARRPAPPLVVRPPITVAVSGEVVRPGMYEVEFGARVEELLRLAGGFLPTAARSLVQLAAPLTDGQSVVVPALATPGGTERVSLNSADPARLETLPGIGPATARRIVEHRPYARIDDLLRVPGIGPKKLERLRALVTL
ncbi:MAG TPA: ComEA family DNA-binding protein [Trueperaceae bacterium]|nr:ComEA family DNA-binding protein [Trueperaceae bacterium]